MNERIKKLKEQATSYTWNGNDVTEELHENKFAELIVRECMKLCEHEANDDEFDYYDMGRAVKAESIKTAIKQHFGVEE